MSGFLSGKIYGTSVDSEDIKDATIVGQVDQSAMSKPLIMIILSVSVSS